jgi:hypothetical protein
MGMGAKKLTPIAAGVCLPLLFGQPSACAEEDHALVLKIGPAGEGVLHERPNFGGTFAAEKTLIEGWLSVEAGLTILGSTGQTELSGDIIFKKPFQISPSFEFMVGAGPSISKPLIGEDQRTQVSAAFTLDFMFWPTKDIGWFLEPNWNYNPRSGQHSFSASIGLLVGIPQR